MHKITRLGIRCKAATRKGDKSNISPTKAFVATRKRKNTLNSNNWTYPLFSIASRLTIDFLRKQESSSVELKERCVVPLKACLLANNSLLIFAGEKPRLTAVTDRSTFICTYG